MAEEKPIRIAVIEPRTSQAEGIAAQLFTKILGVAAPRPQTSRALVVREDAAVLRTEQAERDAELSPETAAAIAAGRAEATSRAYQADRADFARWCTDRGRTALPASAETLATYAVHLTSAPRPRTGRPASPSSIDRALSAIATWHTEHDLPKPPTIGARTVINGYKATLALAKDPAAKPRKATAAVPAALRTMLAMVDRTTLAGKRDAALVLLGFATAARVSELAAVDIAELRPTEEGLDTSIYRAKVKLFTDNIVLYGSDPATCPVRAVRAYTAALAQAGRTEGPLLVRVDRHGRPAVPMTRAGQPIGDPAGRMTPKAVGEVVTRLADRAQLTGDWSGHSLRRGFATAARLAGHDPLRIGRAGGWADGSKALAGYMDDVDRVTGSPLVGIGL